MTDTKGVTAMRRARRRKSLIMSELHRPLDDLLDGCGAMLSREKERKIITNKRRKMLHKTLL